MPPFQPRPISLVLLLQDLEFGGTQRYALHLLNLLDRDRFSPELWVLRGGSDMIGSARSTGVKITLLSKTGYVGPWALARLMVRILKHSPDLLYTLTVMPNIWGRIFGKIAGVPAVISGYRSLLPRQHEKWLWRLSTRIICNADILRQMMISHYGVDEHRIAVIPNGVDMEYFRPSMEEQAPHPTLLFVGRLVREKDPLSLVEVFSMVLLRVPEARMEIIGKGRLRDTLEEAVRSRGLGSRIKLSAPTRDIRDSLHRAWILVLPSIEEASPNVIIEAMAVGLPVVASRVGGIPELVEDNKTGILVGPNDPQGFASAITRLLINRSERLFMGREAREKALANHTLEGMIRSTEKVFLEAADDLPGCQ